MVTCLLSTPEIKKLSNEVAQTITEVHGVSNSAGIEALVKSYISRWYEANELSIETQLPTAEQLRSYIREVNDPQIRNLEKDIAQIIREDNQEQEDSSDKKLSQIEMPSTKQRDVSPLPEEVTKVFAGYSFPTVATLEAIDRLFDPIKRKDRVGLIARIFSEKLERRYADRRKDLQDRLSRASARGMRDLEDNINIELNKLTKTQVLKEVTPAGIFKDIYKDLYTYVQTYKSNPEKVIATELADINQIPGAEKRSLQKRQDLAKKRATYKAQEYSKMIDDVNVFKALASEAGEVLITTEGVRLDPNYNVPIEVSFSEEDVNGESVLENLQDTMEKEDTPKEYWMQSFRQISVHESLSEAVRSFIRQIPRLIENGRVDIDDLWQTRYLDPMYVITTILDQLRVMTRPSQMIPLLEELVDTKPWMAELVRVLKYDLEASKGKAKGDDLLKKYKLDYLPKGALYKQFYRNFRKDFTNYAIQKLTRDSNGNYKRSSSIVNRSEGIGYLMDNWRQNYQGVVTLDKDQIYDSEGKYLKPKARIGLKIVNDLVSSFRELNEISDIEERKAKRAALIDDPKIFGNIMKALHMIGADPSPIVVKRALTKYWLNKDNRYAKFEYKNAVDELFGKLSDIFDGVIKGKIETTTNKNNIESRGDLVNTFGSAYRSIAKMFADVTEDATEGSVTQNGSTYNSHTTSNYMGKLIKNLRGEGMSEEDYVDYITKEFQNISWFYKDGVWRNEWLRQIVEDPKMRAAFDHKVVLSMDGNTYQRWNALDYALVLLTEYYAENPNKRGPSYAWYAVPVLSDAHSAEFIRFRKYTGDNYKKEILNGLVNLVLQEYDRIAHVRARAVARNRGEQYAEALSYFDMSTDEEGNITNMGGGEFKFIPALNDLQMVMRDGDGAPILAADGSVQMVPFLQELSRVKDNYSGDALRRYIENALQTVMDNGFETAYRQWMEMGLLDENEDGFLTNLTWFKSNFKRNNARVISVLKDVRDNYLNDNPILKRSISQLITALDNRQYIREEYLNSLLDELKTYLNNTLDPDIAASMSKMLNIIDYTRENLRKYYWNSTFATSQMLELLVTDLAYFNGPEGVLKRIKALHSPSMKMDNEEAFFEGEDLSQENERAIYLADSEIISNEISQIEKIVMAEHDKGNLSDYDAAWILSKYGRFDTSKGDFENDRGIRYTKVGKVSIKTDAVNVTDGQSLRTLDSRRALGVMAGEWTDEKEKAYNNIVNGTWSANDLKVIFEVEKPFYFSQIKQLTGYEQVTDRQGNLIDDLDRPIYSKIPVIHKNSEFLLLSNYLDRNSILGSSAKMRAIGQFMKDHKIDVLHYESVVKAGKQGVINLNNIPEQGNFQEIYDTTLSALEEATDDGQNPYVVHELPYEDYGRQQENPEHFLNKTQLIGTQLRKLIMVDIDPNTKISVGTGQNGSRTMSKQEWLQAYNTTIVENTLQAYDDVKGIFGDIHRIEKELQREIMNNPRYGNEIKRAITVDETGKFTIPLCDPIQSSTIQPLLLSIIRNRVNRQEMKGGMVTQVSDIGYTDNLHILYKDGDSTKGIIGLECYISVPDSRLYAPYIDSQTGEIDVNKLPDDLRQMIGYRIPTEYKYSMLPLYVKGFLPAQYGAAIMLPADITTMTGSDFDIDKLYIIAPEFEQVFDTDRAWRDFWDNHLDLYEQAKKNKKKEGGNRKLYTYLPQAQDEFTLWVAPNRSDYITRVEKVQYNHDFKIEDLKDFTSVQRHNLLFDLMFGAITTPENAIQMTMPGGFADQKKVARIVTLLTSNSKEDLIALLNANRGKDDPMVTEKSDLAAVLSQMDGNKIDNLATLSKRKVDPLSPATQVDFHQRVVVGGTLIGIYANHNANHAIIQNTDLHLYTGAAFTLNDKSFTSLHEIKNSEGQFIAKNIAGFLAAAPDDIKEQILADLNQNIFTADTTALLIRLGYTPMEVGILMNQPIIKEITQAYFRNYRKGIDAVTIIDNVIHKYKGLSIINSGASIARDMKRNKFLLKDLINNILEYNRLFGENIDIEDNGDLQVQRAMFYSDQEMIGELFKKIYKSAIALGAIARNFKYDTAQGGSDSTIAGILVKMLQLHDIRNNAMGQSYPIAGVVDLIQENLLNGNPDIETLRNKIFSSRLPMMQAFYTLGLEASMKFLKAYFPQAGDSFIQIANTFREMSPSKYLDAKSIEKIWNNLFAYIMTKDAFFGEERRDDGTLITAKTKRDAFINYFPQHFQELIAEEAEKDATSKKKNPYSLANLGLIQRIKYRIPNGNNPVSILMFKNVGSLNPVIKERFTRDWMTLTSLNNPHARELSLDFILYNFFRNGLAFGPQTFTHLAPVAVRKLIPGYTDHLNNLIDSDDNYMPFILQYIYNHLDDRRFVPEIGSSSQAAFIGENNQINEEITFTINKGTTSDDLKIIMDTEDGEFLYYDLIQKRIKGRQVYYQFDGEEIDAQGERKVHYKHTTKTLGYPNSFLEYEYGKDANEVETVIKRNTDKSDEEAEDLYAFMQRNNDPTEILAAAPGQEYYGESIPMDEYDLYNLQSKQNLVEETYNNNDIQAIQAGQDAAQMIFNKEISPNEATQDGGFDTLIDSSEYTDAEDKRMC